MTKEELITRIEKKEQEIEKFNKRITKLSSEISSTEILELAKAYGVAEIGSILRKELRLKIKAITDTRAFTDEYFHIEDLLNVYTGLHETTKALQKYKTQLDKEINFENETKIQVLVDFLAQWKEKTLKWYIGCCEELIRLQQSYKEDFTKHLTQIDTDNLTRRDLYNIEHDFKAEYFETVPKIVNEFVTYDQEIKTDEIEKMLDKEVKAKYIDLVNRITAVVGEIQDVKHLSIGDQNGEINGIVKGSKGKAQVDTISAGGYAVQIFHYRVLVKKLKD